MSDRNIPNEQQDHRHRLLDVAKALRETANPKGFEMGSYVHTCGAPACALGNYAFRSDLQDAFEISRKMGFWDIVFTDDPGAYCGYAAPRVHEYFGITFAESGQLFSGDGCNGARTADQAATYIERFADRKWPALSLGAGFAAFRKASLTALLVTKETP